MGEQMYKSAGRDGLLITSRGQLVIHSEMGRRKKLDLYTRHKNQSQVDERPKCKRQRHLIWSAPGPAQTLQAQAWPHGREKGASAAVMLILGTLSQ